jgi:hypothetical protein
MGAQGLRLRFFAYVAISALDCGGGVILKIFESYAIQMARLSRTF